MFYISIELPEILSSRSDYYSLIFTKNKKRYWYGIEMRAKSLEKRVRVNEIPLDKEVIDISIGGNW